MLELIERARRLQRRQRGRGLTGLTGLTGLMYNAGKSPVLEYHDGILGAAGADISGGPAFMTAPTV